MEKWPKYMEGCYTSRSKSEYLSYYRIWIDLVQYGGGTLVLKDTSTAEQDTVQFWTNYSNAIAENMKKAVLARGQ